MEFLVTKVLFSWRHAIVESDLPPTTKHVLLTLSLHMNDVGESCFPSIERLARETSLSKRAVITHLHASRDAGWIKIGNHGFRGQRWRANEYLCDFPSFTNEKVVNEGNHVGEKAVNLTTEGGEPDDSKVVNEVHSISTSNSALSATKENARPSDTRPVAGKPKKPQPGFNPALIDLPDWLDRDLWAAWCDERKLRRKPITERAAAMQIKKLAEYRDQGYSPQEVIEHSIAGGYQGLFAPTRSKSHETSRSDNRRETPLEAGMREHANLLRRIENGTVHEWLADGDGEALEPWGEPKRIGR